MNVRYDNYVRISQCYALQATILLKTRRKKRNNIYNVLRLMLYALWNILQIANKI